MGGRRRLACSILLTTLIQGCAGLRTESVRVSDQIDDGATPLTHLAVENVDPDVFLMQQRVRGTDHEHSGMHPGN